MNKENLTRIAEILGLTEEEVSAIYQHSPDFIMVTSNGHGSYAFGRNIKNVTINIQDTPEDSFYGTNIDITKSVVGLIKALRK